MTSESASAKYDVENVFVLSRAMLTGTTIGTPFEAANRTPVVLDVSASSCPAWNAVIRSPPERNIDMLYL